MSTNQAVHALAAFLLLLAAPTPGTASGLVVSPQRVVIEGRQREAKVTLSNTGSEATTYRLFWVNYKMLPSGDFEPITSPTTEFLLADQYVRFAPRQVVLPPGETQVIRLLVRMPAMAESGEYRSHLVFQAQPKKPDFDANTPKGRTSAVITTLYGVSIPVIIRRGHTAATVTVGDTTVLPASGPTSSRLRVSLRREGNESVYGNVLVEAKTEKGWEPLGASNGLAVYVPLAERYVDVPLRTVPEKGVTLRVTFEDSDTKKPLAQKTLESR